MGDVVAAFTTLEAQKLTSLTARRLQYWDETDFIRPSVAARKGRGSPRLYAFRDLVQLRVAAILRDNLSLQALRRLKSSLDVEAPFASLTFCTTPDGDVVYLGPTGHLEAARYPGQILLTFDVPLQEIRTDLHTRIADLRRRRGVGKVDRTRGVLAGQSRISGTRISTAAIARLVAGGLTQDQIRAEYPELEQADIAAALRPAKAG